MRAWWDRQQLPRGTSDFPTAAGPDGQIHATPEVENMEGTLGSVLCHQQSYRQARRVPDRDADFMRQRRHTDHCERTAVHVQQFRRPEQTSEVLKLLQEFCLAEENVMYERHTFYRRKQEEDESLESFITSIRTLARTCDFKENGVDFSSQIIRDRLVCGRKDDSVRLRYRRLLSASDKQTGPRSVSKSRGRQQPRVNKLRI